MTDEAIIGLIGEKLKIVEAHGFGEVVIKIRNGTVYRILLTTDTIVEHCNSQLTKVRNSSNT